MKLWVDDIRSPKYSFMEGWEWAKTYDDAIAILMSGIVDKISLDHDLGSSDPIHTGYGIACWIEERVVSGEIRCPKMYCHSMNPVGRQKINIVIDRLRPYIRPLF